MTACAYALFKRPTPVLCHMPQSCNLVYDLLATSMNLSGCSTLTMAEIGATTRRARQTVFRALKRLIGARLLEIHTRRTGRGQGHTYFIRSFKTGSKRRNPAAERVYLAHPFSFTQESVTPSYPYTQKKLKSRKASEDVSNFTVPSPGKVMFHVRTVVQSNASLSDQEKKAICYAFGKGVFKRGDLPRFQEHPAALQDLLNLLARPRPPGKPPRRAAVCSVYAWTFGLIQSILEKHRLGMGSLSRRLETQLAPAPPVKPRRHRVEFKPRRRLTYAERGVTPSWVRI